MVARFWKIVWAAIETKTQVTGMQGPAERLKACLQKKRTRGKSVRRKNRMPTSTSIETEFAETLNQPAGTGARCFDGQSIAQVAQELTLETVLDIWQTATDRLQQTHLTLQQEIRRLTDELEEKNRQLARKNRLADLGQMAAHVAHEVRNNLVPMTLYMSLLKRQLQSQACDSKVQSEQSVGLLSKIENGVNSMKSMVLDLLNFTSEREPQLELTLIEGILQDLIQEIKPQCNAQNVQVQTQFHERLDLKCDPDMLRRAVRNLLLNAIDATGDGGILRLSSLLSDSHIEIVVEDSGNGIDDAALEKLFDPFYTTKSTGTGLGLSVVERIMESHRGQVQVSHSELGGAKFSLKFSLAQMNAVGPSGTVAITQEPLHVEVALEVASSVTS